MNLLLDGLIAVVCGLMIYLGYKRGFVRSVMSVFSLIVSMVVGFAFAPTLAAKIEKTKTVQSIFSTIATTIKSLSEKVADGYDVTGLFEQMPDTLLHILERYKIDSDSVQHWVTDMQEATQEQITELSQRIAKPVVNAICSVSAFLLIFFCVFLALTLLTLLLDLIFQLPPLKTANESLGLAVGIVNAIVWAWALSSAFCILIPALASVAPNAFPVDCIEKTYIVRFFNSNLFHSMIEWVWQVKDTLE